MKQRSINICSNDNTLFVTSQCNNHCIMCCQPPIKVDDINKLYEENIARIKQAPKALNVIGITGGEPTLLGDKLIDLIKLIRIELPKTEIHLLSNGRKFIDNDYTHRIAEAAEGKMVVGVPLHSDYYKDHDIIAGAKGAYNETVLGLYNLAYEDVRIELRIVMNKLNHTRFLSMAEFIHKNLPFVCWTAFMGMEYVGDAVLNKKHIWIEPKDYIDDLKKAVKYLDDWGYSVDIYNIPLCLLPFELRKFAQKSISDWKNKFIEECYSCKIKEDCCGLFSTSKKIYLGLKAIN